MSNLALTREPTGLVVKFVVYRVGISDSVYQPIPQKKVVSESHTWALV